jgi:glycosyltransferase involved in cell wall biosynthesis
MMSAMSVKVLYFTHPTAFNNFGGAEVQLLKTKEHVEKLSRERGQLFSIKLFDIFRDKLEDFDMLHNFQSHAECLSMLQLAKLKGLKTVLSPVYWTHSYTRFRPTGIGRLYSNLKSYRIPTFQKLFPIKDSLDLADIILPNSRMEASLLSISFRVDPRKFFVVPNGVDERFYYARPDIFVEKYGLEDFVLFVGRIESRKNVLQLLKACNELGLPTVIIGDFHPLEKEYAAECMRLLKSSLSTKFIGFLPHDSEELLSAYAAAKVFVLPSLFETPGLAALEAGLAGCNLVVTSKGSTKEYFQEHAMYVNPESFTDLKEKILEAYKKKKSSDLRNRILQNFSWDKVAFRTLEAYRKIL